MSWEFKQLSTFQVGVDSYWIGAIKTSEHIVCLGKWALSSVSMCVCVCVCVCVCFQLIL